MIWAMRFLGTASLVQRLKRTVLHTATGYNPREQIKVASVNSTAAFARKKTSFCPLDIDAVVH